MIRKAAYLVSSLFDYYSSNKRIENIQRRKLTALLNHAGLRVPYYRELFRKEGIDAPGEINEKTVFEILKRIPILSKEMLHFLDPEHLISDGYSMHELIKEETSGSSGIKTAIYLTAEERSRKDVIRLRSLLLSGYNPLFKRVDCGMTYEKPAGLLSRIGLFRTETVLTSESVEKALTKIKKFKPRYLAGYPHFIQQISEKLQPGEVKVDRIITIGEMLNPVVREKLRKLFCAEVRDHYGAIEVGRLAFEDRSRTGMYLNEDKYFVEVTTDGEVIVTPLEFFVMPLLRYHIGDKIEVGESRDNRRRRMIKVINGRSDDFTITRGGKKIPPATIEGLLLLEESILEFRVLQRRQGTLDIYIVSKEGFIANEFKMKFQRQIPDMDVEIIAVKEIPRNEGKKFKSISVLKGTDQYMNAGAGGLG